MSARTPTSTPGPPDPFVFLVDTNVVSEARKGTRVNPGVRDFFTRTDPAALYLAAPTIGELRRGVEILRLRGDGPQAKALEAWLNLIVTDYSDRILAFDTDCAQVWGRLMAPNPHHPIDKQIAAIALIHGLEVVTRNTEDFVGTGAVVSDPFV